MITFLSGFGGGGINGSSGLSGNLYATISTTSINLSTLSISVNISLTVGLGLSYSVAQSVLVANSISNYFQGLIVSYNSETGAMVINVTTIVGSATLNSWQVNNNFTIII